MKKTVIALYLFSCLAFFVPEQVISLSAPLLFPIDLRVSLYSDDPITALMVPVFLRSDMYSDMFDGDRRTLFATYLFNTSYDGGNAMLIPAVRKITNPYVALWKEGEQIQERWYIPSQHHAYVTTYGTYDLPEGYREAMLYLPVQSLEVSHRFISRLNGTVRLYDKQGTVFKDYFSVWLQWQQNIPILDDDIASYIQEGTLTCEFASAKNALDMIGVSVSEQELISRFPQGAVYDISKNPQDYFLGDYGFDHLLPQTISTLYSPLGGYGLHIDLPYLERIIRPYAAASIMVPFSFEAIDQALLFPRPIIVQGVIFSRQGAILGGWPLQVDNNDRRGLVAGEHTFVIFGKTIDGQYRVKDPFKNGFFVVSPNVISQSVLTFEKYGAKSNMVIVAK